MIFIATNIIYADKVGNGQKMLKGHINYFKTFYRDTDIPSYRLA